ncbi:MAG: alpha/beta fold hydrolase [Acidimicrobiales bacterium]
MDLACLGGGEFQGSKLVMPRPPNDNAERLLPQVTAVTLPGASNHSLPATNSDQLNEALDTFLAA